MRAIIFSNGTIENYERIKQYLRLNDYIICADGGAKHAIKLKILPDLIMGDFDSIEDEWFHYFESKNTPMERFPVEKDQTDTEIALQKARDIGATEVMFLGSTGTRLDHTLGNISLLKQALEMNIYPVLVDDYNEVFIVNNRIQILGQKNDLVSLLPLTEVVEGIHATNLYYPVEDMTMSIGSPLGISNVLLENESLISVKKGILLVIKSRDT